MTDQELSDFIRKGVDKLECGDIAEAIELCADLEEIGIKRNIHLGVKEASRRMTLEWYAGQFIDIVKNKAWYAVNSWINCADRFL